MKFPIFIALLILIPKTKADDSPPIGAALLNLVRPSNLLSVAVSLGVQIFDWAKSVVFNVGRAVVNLVTLGNHPSSSTDSKIMDKKTREEKEKLLADAIGVVAPTTKKSLIKLLKKVGGLLNLANNIGSTGKIKTPVVNFAKGMLKSAAVEKVSEFLPGVDLKWGAFERSISIQGANSVMHDYIGVMLHFVKTLQEGVYTQRRGLIDWHIDPDFRLKRCDGSVMEKNEFIEEYLMTDRLNFMTDLKDFGILPDNDIWEDPKKTGFSMVLLELSYGWYFPLLYVQLLTEDNTDVTFVVPCKHFNCKLAYAQVSSCQ